MCRSKAEGGRRCPGTTQAAHIGHGMASAPTRPGGRSTVGRAAASAQAWEALNAAKAEIGPPLGNPSYLVVGPLSRQAELARHGGDPAIYDQQVAEGRAMLTSLLVGNGVAPDVAAAKVSRLESAYSAWTATPEA